MARKRRKYEHRQGEEAIKRHEGVPKDTNVEVLPERGNGVEKKNPAQVQRGNFEAEVNLFSWHPKVRN